MTFCIFAGLCIKRQYFDDPDDIIVSVYPERGIIVKSGQGEHAYRNESVARCGWYCIRSLVLYSAKGHITRLYVWYMDMYPKKIAA